MQKRHRIFIAINLPPDIKKFLARYQKNFQELPSKWVSEENLHVTLIFLGDLADEELAEVCVMVKKVANNHASFEINLNNVSYGPASNASRSNAVWPNNKTSPRFIWAVGEKSKELSLLKKDLEESLLGKIHFVTENRGFVPHVTLARISTWQWRQIEPEERPQVNENIDLAFIVESIEVMESELKRGGPQYIVVESQYLDKKSII